VGQISDLLIDLTGQKKPFAILSKARLLKRGENYAVPLRSMSQSADHRLKIEANGAALTQAQPSANKPGRRPPPAADLFITMQSSAESRISALPCCPSSILMLPRRRMASWRLPIEGLLLSAAKGINDYCSNFARGLTP